jgi:hypothetical protein
LESIVSVIVLFCVVAVGSTGVAGGIQMTTLARLLARKEQLIERPRENPGLHEREEIERQLAEIDEALNLLDEARPGASSKDGQ